MVKKKKNMFPSVEKFSVYTSGKEKMEKNWRGKNREIHGEKKRE